MSGLLIAGTSSDAGKSLFVTGLCRVARRRGIDVAPFKSQNMSNNSMVCLDGSEIGRAQYLQATAAGVTPSSLLNPVLLKPGTDRRSFVVLRGQPHGTLEAGEYATSRRHLADAAYAAYEELAATHELIICEGAGSPAEINLRKGDYTNMGLARQFDLPTVLVGDIDRGGVLASIYGTWALLDDADRALLAGYVINKFRGDQSILDPGLDDISGRTGLTNFGVLPYLHGVWVDGEDALEVGRWRNDGTSDADGRIVVAAVRLPRISNATDVDALAQEPGVRVIVTVDPREVERADLVVLPGSRSTLSDLAWLRETGIADVIVRRAAQGRPVLGICGGFQMCARTIDDDVEGEGVAPGLGLLPVDIAFHTEKVLGRPEGEWRGHAVDGYTIHHGRPTVDPGAEPFLDG
ncbi:MAG TPA: cobyric acid synthase, partial [Arachnia sp.]|nr:cobyric acid synthase [Arachnia sp.]